MRTLRLSKKILTMKITSTSNPRIKQVIDLHKPRERREQGLFIIEGEKEIGFAADSGINIKTVFYAAPIINQKSKIKNAEWIEVTDNVYSRMAYRDDSSGMIAVAETKKFSLEKIKLSKNPLLILIEKVEKPGNLGAILRTADAAKVDAVIVCDQQTDLLNPNVIRSSLGTLFTNQIAQTNSEEAIEWLKKNKIKIFSTSPDAKSFYHEINLNQPCAIVMGSEAEGLSKIWFDESDELIKIPMAGKIDSLNVSVSTAIVVFEVVRQRKLKS